MFYYYGRKKRIVKYYPKPLHDNIIEPFAGCYDVKTRVMTKRGLIYFDELTINDEIMTLNQNSNKIEYQKPSHLQRYHYNGDMYQFKGKSYDLLVTPDHNMYLKEQHRSKYELIKANKLSYSNYHIPITGEWVGFEQKLFSIPRIDSKTAKNFGDVDMITWLKFMGIFLSEGWTNGDYYIGISQTKEDVRYEIENVLNDIDIRYDKFERHYRIVSKQLCSYLKKFGKGYQKYVPDYIKNLPKEYLSVFLYYYGLGDDSKRSFGEYEYFWTVSNKMKDDIIEIIIKMGFNVSLSCRKRTSIIYGREVTNVRNCWCITKNVSINRKLNLKKHLKTLPYDDMVYCATVPNHVMMVERNGNFVWCGNSAAYSMEYFENDVTLYEINHKIYSVWKYLQNASMTDILNLPLLIKGQCLNDKEFDYLSDPEKWTIGLFLNPGSSVPKKSPGNFCSWDEKRRKELSGEIFKIKHWDIRNESYENAQILGDVTWFIDPPYSGNGGKYYVDNKIDYEKLRSWCIERKGQTIVCENEGATWLPFKSLVDLKGQRHNRKEVIWYNEK